MLVSILACLALALQGTDALSKTDCTSFDLTATETGMLEKYCTRAALRSRDIVFGDSTDSKKFLICTDVKTGCTGSCTGNFDKATKACGCSLPSGTDISVPLQPLDKLIGNPCSKAQDKTCFFFDHTTKNRFIICEDSKTQTPKVAKCKDGYDFSFNSQACLKQTGGQYIVCKGVKNPCKPIPPGEKVINTDRLYFTCVDDPTKFIQCTLPGKMYIKQCKNNTVWSQKIHACAFHAV